MSGELDFVPPTLSMLMEVLSESKTIPVMRKQIRGMFGDLRDQSEAYLSRDGAFETGTIKGGFQVHLHGALDLLSGQGCQEFRCKVSAAERIAQTFGLFADKLWMTDSLSANFVRGGRLTNDRLDEIIADVVCLMHLAPLINAGIVKFRPSWLVACKSCVTAFSERNREISQKLANRFKGEVEFVAQATGKLDFETGSMFDSVMHYYDVLSTDSTLEEREAFLQQFIEDEIRSAFSAASYAARSGGAVASNSRLGLAGIYEAEGTTLDAPALRLLDKERKVVVPWVSKLHAGQILELRSDAETALGPFREKILKAMAAPDDGLDSSSGVASIVQELREQAEEVRAELAARSKTAAGRWKKTYGVLALGLSVYGGWNEQILPAGMGVLGMLQLLIGHKTGHEQDVEKLRSKPGYVLVKAQNILSHAHD